MQALQTLSQREFEMMQCFWEADEPLKMKELQTRWNLNGIMRVI